MNKRDLGYRLNGREDPTRDDWQLNAQMHPLLGPLLQLVLWIVGSPQPFLDQSVLQWRGSFQVVRNRPLLKDIERRSQSFF